ncbi:MAG: hypothetical protein ABSB87_13255 [Terriglobales bacterium]
MDTTRERENQMAWGAQLACGVLLGTHEDGTPTLDLLNLDEKIAPQCAVLLAKQRSRYIGLLTFTDGVVDGLPCAFDPATLHAFWGAVPHFVEYAAKELAPPEATGDSSAWLEKLHALPDTRTN